jgi:hypothetical protein
LDYLYQSYVRKISSTGFLTYEEAVRHNGLRGTDHERLPVEEPYDITGGGQDCGSFEIERFSFLFAVPSIFPGG